MNCPQCGRSGKYQGKTCDACSGSGTYTQSCAGCMGTGSVVVITTETYYEDVDE